MTVAQWSTTPASNATINDGVYGNITWAENQAPSSVNDSARSVMAHIKAWYDNITAGGTITGSNAGSDTKLTLDSADDAILVLDKAASGDSAYIRGATADSTRWVVEIGNATAEGGANAGSNLVITAYADDGATPTGTALSIARSDLATAFGGAVTGVSFTPTSDRRLKTDLQRIEGALDKVSTLTGYTFARIDAPGRHTGLIAQDVQAVLPEAVSSATAEGMLGVNYGAMVGLLVEAIKELRAEVAALKERLA